MSPNFPPPLITTTISVSSMKEEATTLASSRGSDERVPHNIISDKGEPWVELKEVDLKKP
jgi:hypothetical protein